MRTPPTPHQPTALDQLLGAEEAATAKLAKADEEAVRLIAEAHGDVRADDDRDARELERELAELKRVADRETATAVEAIERDALRAVERYDRAVAGPVAAKVIESLFKRIAR